MMFWCASVLAQSAIGQLKMVRGIRIGAIATLAVVLVGCSESKVSQCNRLIEIANGAASQVESETQAVQSGNPDDAEAFRQIAAIADQAATDLEAVELSDETLQEYKQRFITLYAETSAATTALVDAVEQQNPNEAETAYQRLETATAQEGPLVDEVNTYCGGTPPQ